MKTKERLYPITIRLNCETMAELEKGLTHWREWVDGATSVEEYASFIFQQGWRDYKGSSDDTEWLS
jgi:hypothetical protein